MNIQDFNSRNRSNMVDNLMENKMIREMNDIITEANKTFPLFESVLDPIQKYRCPTLFGENNKEQSPKIKKEAREFLLNIAEKFIKDIDIPGAKITEFFMIGSSLGYQYRSDADIDCDLRINVKKEDMWGKFSLIPKGIIYPGSSQPINIFLLCEDDAPYDFENHCENAYDLLEDKWIKQGVLRNEYPIPYSYVAGVSEFIMDGIALQLQRADRHIQDVHKYISLDPERVEISARERADAIADGINDLKIDADALNLSHHFLFRFDGEGFNGEEFRISIDYKASRKHYTINNLIYKYIDGFGYYDKVNSKIKEIWTVIEKAENELEKSKGSADEERDQERVQDEILKEESYEFKNDKEFLKILRAAPPQLKNILRDYEYVKTYIKKSLKDKRDILDGLKNNKDIVFLTTDQSFYYSKKERKLFDVDTNERKLTLAEKIGLKYYHDRYKMLQEKSDNKKYFNECRYFCQNIYAHAVYEKLKNLKPNLIRKRTGELKKWDELFNKDFSNLDVKERDILVGIVEDGGYKLENENVLKESHQYNLVEELEYIERLKEAESVESVNDKTTVLNNLRSDIQDEYTAIKGYDAHADFAEKNGCSDIAEIIRDIRDEEKVHIGELEAVMKKYDKEFKDSLTDGGKEAEEILKESKKWNIKDFNNTEALGRELGRLHAEKEKHLSLDDMPSSYYENIDSHIKQLNNKMKDFDCKCEKINEELLNEIGPEILAIPLGLSVGWLKHKKYKDIYGRKAVKKYKKDHGIVDEDNIKEEFIFENRLPEDGSDPQFGVPQQKKYPLYDKAHVEAAIKLFVHVDAEYEQQLARAIMVKMKKYGIPYDSVSPDNKLYKWIPESYKTKKE